MSHAQNLIGIIPAAGYAKRVAPLSCSKEIYPITISDGGSKAVASCLLERYREAGVDKAYLITRKEKWDIVDYFGDGSSVGVKLAFIVVDPTEGVPQTIDAANSFTKNYKVLFGFPDILFQPANAFNVLLKKQRTTNSDLVLGLFEADQPEKMDMVDITGDGKLKSIIIKPAQTTLTYTWIIAVWTPVFSAFLHEYLLHYKRGFPEQGYATGSELYLGDVFRDAIQAGLHATYVKFEEGKYLDIGTPADLKKVNNVGWI